MRLNPRRIRALVWRHMVTWPRDLENLVDSFWWPSFDIFIWGLMTVYLRGEEDVASIVTGFIIGGIVLWMFVYRSQQEVGMMFLKEAWDRNLMSIIASPVTPAEFLAASLVLGIIKLTISGIWMSVLAYVLFAFNVFSFGLYIVPFILSLLVVGWWAGFIVNGLVIRYGWRVQALAWSLIIIIQPFSAVFYPVSSMPGWMQAVSSLIPTSYIFEGMREALLTGRVDPGKLAISFLLNAAYVAGSVFFFRYSFRKAQESGMIVKFS